MFAFRRMALPMVLGSCFMLSGCVCYTHDYGCGYAHAQRVSMYSTKTCHKKYSETKTCHKPTKDCQCHKHKKYETDDDD